MRLEDIRGLGTPAKYEALRRYGAMVPADLAIVEVGTFCGKSACYLASESAAHVWTIDPHDLPGERKPTGLKGSGMDYTRPQLREAASEAIRATGLGKKVTMVRDFGVSAGKEWFGQKVGLLHIDGDHRDEAVRGDWRAWRTHLAEDALVLFDDATDDFPGVKSLVAYLLHANWVEQIDDFDGLLVTRYLR